MIERDFITQKTKELAIKNYLLSKLDKTNIASIKLKKIPLGEKIIIETCKPSLVVGSKGSNIKALTKSLKQEFNLENPQIEINEVKNIYLDAHLVAQKIASSLEKFGSARFKGIGHKVMENVMKSGALGVEIVISGKIPSARAKSWRFYNGYLKKCGDVAMNGVKIAHTGALLKTGIVGIKVSIMPPELILPDHIDVLDVGKDLQEENKSNPEENNNSEEDKKNTKKKAVKKVIKKNKKDNINTIQKENINTNINVIESKSNEEGVSNENN